MKRREGNGSLTKLFGKPTLGGIPLLNASLNHRDGSRGHIPETGTGGSGAWPNERFDDASTVR